MIRKVIISSIILLSIVFTLFINRYYIKTYVFKKLSNESIKFSKVDYPSFSLANIDKFINNYISINYKEKVVHYNYYDINGEYTSFFIKNETDLTHECFLIDNRTNKRVSIEDIIINKDEFNNIVINYLNLKYPSFIIDSIKGIDNKDISYLINNDSLIIYYDKIKTSPEYNKDIYIRISLLALKDVLELEIDNNKGIILDSENLDKVVALTFDDGPCSNTDKILELLKDNNSTATFFLQGYKINSFKNTLIKMIDYGNEAGNHTYSHKYLTKIKQKEFDFQLNKTNELYYNVTNKSMYLIRPPYGSYNKKVKQLVSGPIILWNLDTKDWKGNKTVEEIISSVLDNVNDGDIILMHDIHEKTYDALKTILPELYIKGFKVVSVSELAEIKRITLLPGNTYTKIN